jgi:Flp pilus assembly protein TadG
MLSTRVSKKNNGSILILATLLVPILCGLLFMMIYLGQTLLVRNQMQNAVDAAALAAANKMANGGTIAEARTEASNLVTENLNHYHNPDRSALVTTEFLLADVINETNPSHVRVTLSNYKISPIVDYFGNLNNSLTQARRAKARIGTKLPCVLNLDTANNGGFKVAGGSSVVLDNCSLASNSGLTLGGVGAEAGGTLWASSLHIQNTTATPAVKFTGSNVKACIGIVYPTTTGCATTQDTTPRTLYTTPMSEPSYLSADPVSAGSNQTPSIVAKTTTLVPGTYTSSVAISGNGKTLIFDNNGTNQNTFVFKGGLSMNMGNASNPNTIKMSNAAGGVFIYIDNASPPKNMTLAADLIQLNANLSGSGTHQGVLIRQNPLNTTTASLTVGTVGVSTLNGDMSFPNADFKITGGSTTSTINLGIVVAKTFKVAGGSHLKLKNITPFASPLPNTSALVE